MILYTWYELTMIVLPESWCGFGITHSASVFIFMVHVGWVCLKWSLETSFFWVPMRVYFYKLSMCTFCLCFLYVLFVLIHCDYTKFRLFELVLRQVCINTWVVHLSYIELGLVHWVYIYPTIHQVWIYTLVIYSQLSVNIRSDIYVVHGLYIKLGLIHW